MTKFCLFIPLQHGAYIIGVVDMFIGLSGIAWLPMIWNMGDNNIHLAKDSSKQWPQDILTFGILSVVLGLLLACSAFTLIYGASTLNGKYVLPWIVMNIIVAFFILIQIVVFIVVFKMKFQIVPFLAFCIVLRIYFGVIVWRMYHKVVFGEDYVDYGD